MKRVLTTVSASMLALTMATATLADGHIVLSDEEIETLGRAGIAAPEAGEITEEQVLEIQNVLNDASADDVAKAERINKILGN